MSQPAAALVWCPFPDRDSARDAARQLLDEKLIACANLIPNVESVFLWEGEVNSGEEVAVLFKTVASCCDQLVSRLGDLHPYDTPAIVGWNCDFAHPETRNWLERMIG